MVSWIPTQGSSSDGRYRISIVLFGTSERTPTIHCFLSREVTLVSRYYFRTYVPTPHTKQLSGALYSRLVCSIGQRKMAGSLLSTS